MAQTTVNANAETNEILKQLESKMSGIMGVVDSLSRKVDETNDMFVSSDSAYFLNNEPSSLRGGDGTEPEGHGTVRCKWPGARGFDFLAAGLYTDTGIPS